MHIDALDTFAFLKSQVGTGYYEELIRKYLLDNTHGAIVVVISRRRAARPEWTGSWRRSWRPYKDSLSDAQKEQLGEADTKKLEDYQSQPDRPEDIGEDPGAAADRISLPGDRARSINEETTLAAVCRLCSSRDVETNGIGYVDADV